MYNKYVIYNNIVGYCNNLLVKQNEKWQQGSCFDELMDLFDIMCDDSSILMKWGRSQVIFSSCVSM